MPAITGMSRKIDCIVRYPHVPFGLLATPPNSSKSVVLGSPPSEGSITSHTLETGMHGMHIELACQCYRLRFFIYMIG